MLEPDRKELLDPPAYQFPVNRREFLEVAGVIIFLPAAKALAQDAPNAARLRVNPDGSATVFSGKVEVGQGARTEIAMAVAEELKIAPERVTVVLGDTDLCPNDGITAGSRTTPSTVPLVRKASSDHASHAVTPPDEWKVLGTAYGRLDAREIVTGKHQYTSDYRKPGMLYGSVLRAPAYNATLASIDTAAAEKLPGVTVVRDGGFVACAAPTSFAARGAIKILEANAKWTLGEHPSSDRLFEVLRKTAEKPREQNQGALPDGFAKAAKKLKSSYQAAFIQHAPMEPRAAFAEWVDGKLTVATGTQNPFGVKQQLQQAFRIPTEKIRVIVPDTGGGFGGKHTGECAIEAARLAKECGKPVLLRWTRAEEFAWAYFRPAAAYDMEAGIDSEGKLTAWDYSVFNAGTAGLNTPYQVANFRTRYFDCNSPLREGSYRGIAATANNFARECFMDELATLAGMDPLAFRLANLESPRLRDVLITAAGKFGWDQRKKNRRDGVGVGIACGTEKGSYVAACVEVETRPGAVKIRDFHMAYECGGILNPSNLRTQVEGAIIQGLGGALTEQIRFEGGKLLNGSFAKYKVPRFRDVPPIEVTLLNRKDLEPAGAGETPIIAVAPAIAGAVFDATGERIRSMPVIPAGKA